MQPILSCLRMLCSFCINVRLISYREPHWVNSVSVLSSGCNQCIYPCNMHVYPLMLQWSSTSRSTSIKNHGWLQMSGHFLEPGTWFSNQVTENSTAWWGKSYGEASKLLRQLIREMWRIISPTTTHGWCGRGYRASPNTRAPDPSLPLQMHR